MKQASFGRWLLAPVLDAALALAQNQDSPDRGVFGRAYILALSLAVLSAVVSLPVIAQANPTLVSRAAFPVGVVGNSSLGRVSADLDTLTATYSTLFSTITAPGSGSLNGQPYVSMEVLASGIVPSVSASAVFALFRVFQSGLIERDPNQADESENEELRKGLRRLLQIEGTGIRVPRAS